MTLLDILERLAGGTFGLISFLEKVAREAPDLEPKVREMIDVLNSAASTANLVEVASILPGEIANVVQGKLDPRDSPGNRI